MRRALLVSYYFPPRFSVGGKRAFRFARYLPEHGWSTVVLTASAPSFEALDASFRDADLPSCEVRRDYLTEGEVARIPRREYGSDGTIDKPTPLFRPLTRKTGLERLRGELRWMPVIGPDARRLPLLATRIARAAKKSGAEVIFASGSPWEVVVASTLAARAVGLPVIVDFRDPWSFGPVTAGRPAWVRAADAYAERRVLAAANALTVTSDTTREAYEGKGARRIETIRNGFDPATVLRPKRDERVTLIHFGNCYCGRTLEPFLRALAAVTHRRGLDRRALRLLNLGRVAAEDVALAEALGVSSMFEHQTVLPYAEGIDLVAGADLALLQGYGEDPWFLPAKLYDYLLARTPILSISTSPELQKILERTRMGWAHAAGDIASLEAHIEAALDARRTGAALVTPDHAAIDAMSARSTAGSLAKLFADVSAHA